MEQPPPPFGEFHGTRALVSFRVRLTLIAYYQLSCRIQGGHKTPLPIFRKALKVQQINLNMSQFGEGAYLDLNLH